MLEFLIERMNPSLLSRFTKFVVTRGSNQINHCWSNDFEMSHSCIEKIFNELRNSNVTAIHVTISYHEKFRETVSNFEMRFTTDPLPCC